MKPSKASFSFQNFFIKSNFLCCIIFLEDFFTNSNTETYCKRDNFPTKFKTEDFAVVSDATSTKKKRNDSIWLNEIFISHNSRIFPQTVLNKLLGA
jgi:hypothetical protein